MFQGEIFIAQLSQIDVQEAVQGFVDKYEPKVLRKLLGITMYNDLLNSVEASRQNPPVPLEQKWISLLNGVDYDSDTRHWDGLEILIANYVYWYYMFDYNVHSVQVGVVKPKSENATPASPVHKMVRAWNEFVNLTCIMHDFIKENLEDYPDYLHKDQYSICEDCQCGCDCGHYPLFKYKNSLGL